MTNLKARVVPADEIIMEELSAGRTLREIADHHNIHLTTLRAHAVKHQMIKRARADARPTSFIQETAEKIIHWRTTIAPGRDADIIPVAISLPRIPTIHGHFQGA